MDPFGDIFCTPRRVVIPDKSAGLVSETLEPSSSSFFETNGSDEDDPLHFLPSNCLIPDCAPVKDDSSRSYNNPPFLKPRFRTHPSSVWAVRDKRKLASNVVEPEEQDERDMAPSRHKRERGRCKFVCSLRRMDIE